MLVAIGAALFVLVPEQAGSVTQRYMFLETLFHELSHSLGPGSIVVEGRKTTVDQELKEIGGDFEEAKADVMGVYNVLFMMDQGVLPAAERPQIRAAYVAGLFRAMRFGANDAHGKGAAMQYRYIRDKGGIVWDAQAKRFRIDETKIDGAIRDLVRAVDSPGVGMLLDLGFADGIVPALAVPERAVPDGTRAG